MEILAIETVFGDGLWLTQNSAISAIGQVQALEEQ